MKRIKLIIFSITAILLILNQCVIPGSGSDSSSGGGNKSKSEKNNNNIPEIISFTGPVNTEYATIDINITTSNDSKIIGWLITETDEKPQNDNTNWLSIKPSSYILSGVGTFTLYAWIKNKDNKISGSDPITVIYTSNDTEPPVILVFNPESTTINISTLTLTLEGTDNENINGWMITESSAKPENNSPYWESSKPVSYSFPCVGTYTLYAWAKDEAGNVSNSKSCTIIFSSDDHEKPVITLFTAPSSVINNSNINITLEATDNNGITKWLIKDNNVAPTVYDSGWLEEKPLTYKIKESGITTLYAWARDDAGNISDSESATVECIDNQPPIINTFTAPSTTGTFTFDIELNGTDNIGITGWLITKTSAKPDVNNSGWVNDKPDTYTLNSAGVHTLYAWAKDNAGNISSSKQITIEKVAPWTIIIQFSIDNNIDYDYEKNYGLVTNYLSTLSSIKQLDVNNNLNIVLLMDCYNDNTNFQDGYYCITGGNFENDLVISLDEINSGNSNDINTFINWAVTNYPAGKYIYSVFGTGSGFDTPNIYGTGSERGLAYDSSHIDSLSLHEIKEITANIKQKTGKKLEMFLAHSWLMSSIELAYEIRNNVNYLTASEEISPFKEWSYEFFNALISNPDISTKNLGIEICNSAYNYFSSIDEYFTISLIDLSKINQLYSFIDYFADEIINYIGNDVGKTNIFDSIIDITKKMCSTYYTDYYYIDFGDYLENINVVNLPENIKNQANSVKSFYDDCIVYEKKYGYNDATGLYILHNVSLSNFEYDIDIYEDIIDFGFNSWTNYLKKLRDLSPTIEGDSYEPDNDFNSTNIMQINDSPQKHTFHTSNDEDTIKINLMNITPGTIVKIETYFSTIVTDTRIYLYNSKANYITDDNDGGNGKYSKIVWQCNNPGIYTIRVKSNTPINNGDYMIDIQEFELMIDEYEEDDDFNTLNTILPGNTAQEHGIDTPTDEDYIKLDLTGAAPGDIFKIETYPSTIQSDTDLYLFDSSYAEIEHNDDKEGSLYSKIEWECLTPGIYYIMIKGHDIQYGNYLVDVKKVE